MKFNVNKLFKFRSILWILIILLLLIVVYNIFVYLNIFEGANEINNTIKTIVISPLENTPSEWLNIQKLKLTDVEGNNMDYTAISTNGRWPYDYGGYILDTTRLYEKTDSEYSMFHSGGTNCTLTITITNPSKILSKITISNRRNCCQDRFKSYKMSFKNSSGIDVIPSTKLDAANLFDPNKQYTHTFDIPVNNNGNVNTNTGGTLQST